MNNMRRRKLVSSVALNVVIAVLAMLWLVPVFWLVVSSFRAEQGAYHNTNLICVHNGW